MIKILSIFVNIVDHINEWAGRISKFGVIVIIVILLFEIASRYFLKSPTSWSTELAAMTFGAYFLLGGGYTLLKGGHVRMDILYLNWSERKRAIINCLTFWLMAVYLITFIVGGYHTLEFAYQFKQRSMSQWAPYLWPIEAIIVIGVFLLLLQGIALFVKDLHLAITGKHLNKQKISY